MSKEDPDQLYVSEEDIVGIFGPRMVERVVHAKGAGAFGYFEVTADVTPWTKADFLSEIGKKTDAFVRFSTTLAGAGSPDNVRDIRGMALRFYTEKGNYDLGMINTPVFFLRDPNKFSAFMEARNRSSTSNLRNTSKICRYYAENPESLHTVTILFSNWGTPHGFRHMCGYGAHTFKWQNVKGDVFWVKYHFHPEAGVQSLTQPESEDIIVNNPDYASEDLYSFIDHGNEVTWKAYIQIMPDAEVSLMPFDPFDITRVWLKKSYPLYEFGRLVLNKNPENYFTEVEQAAFSPSNFVPGIGPSPDPVLDMRMNFYPIANRMRVGDRYFEVPVNQNRAKEQVSAEEQLARYALKEIRTFSSHDAKEDFVQPGILYRSLPEDERRDLINNMARYFRSADRKHQVMQARNCYQADKEYGRRLAFALQIASDELF